ncbi:RING-H2 finger protein ATL40-like [Macadamia integrifolia]|uniref:RING-H2 finger protein ATL40-like n=1 Tax=Macadamia integrifolia TaxID=60698 RepID=UPI001C4ED2E5|nr:RING-H2 finger protein ATL40-like [Macadamia integrifolia]
MDNTTSQSSTNDLIAATQYNMDVNIMRTALVLFLVVITVVVVLNLLHLYAKCALRCRARLHRRTTHLIDITFTADEHMNSHGEPPKHGLDSSIIAALPTFSYRSSDDRVDDDDETDAKECTVCLGTLENEEIVKVLPNCKHIYHVQCIDMWLNSNSTCPVCRTGAKPLEEIGDYHHHHQAPSSQQNETGIDGIVVGVALPEDSSNLPITPPRSDQIVQDIGGAPPVKEGESGLSSLRRILSRERSVRTNRHESGQSDAEEDLERQ